MVQKTLGNTVVQRALSGDASDLGRLVHHEIHAGVTSKGETPSAFDSNAAMHKLIAEMARRAEDEAPSEPPRMGTVSSEVADQLRAERATAKADSADAETAEKVAVNVEEAVEDEKAAEATDRGHADQAPKKGGEPEDEAAEGETKEEAGDDEALADDAEDNEGSAEARGGQSAGKKTTKPKKKKKKKKKKKPQAKEEDGKDDGADAEKVSPKEEMDALKARQERLQADLDDLGAEMEDNQEALEEIQEDVAEVDVETGDAREDLQQRKTYLEKKAEKAREKKKKARDPEDDSTVRSLTKKTEVELPKEKEELDAEAKEIQEENADLQEQQTGVQEELEEVNKRLSELQSKMGGGGGGGGPVAEPNIAKTSAKLLGMLSKTTKPKLEKEAKKAEKKKKDLEKALKKCDTDEADADSAISAASSAVSGANRTIQGAPAKLAARKKVLDDEAGEGKTGNTGADPDSQAIHRSVNAARGQLRIHTNKLNAAKAKKTKAIEDRKKKTKELKDTEKEVKENKEKRESLTKTMAQLAPPGAGMWEALAAEFEVKVTPVPLAPGETNEEHGHEPPPDPDAEQETDAAGKAKNGAASDQAEGAKGVDPKKGDQGPTEAPEKPKTAEEEAAEKKEKRDEAIMAEVSATLDLAPEERAKKWAEMEKTHKLNREQMEAIHKQRLDAAIALASKNKEAALAKNKGADYKDQGALLKASGLTPAQIKVLQAAEARTALQEKALAMVGGADGQAAVDKLHAMGASRGMRPGDLVSHLEGVDPDNKKLSPEMREAAKKARALRTAEIAKITPEADRLAAEKAHKKHIETANTSEKDHQNTQDLAKSLDCDPKQAKSYIDRMVEATGCSRDAAAAALKNKDKSETPMSPKDVQAELARIHAMKPADRAAALAGLAGKVDPQQLVGATMIPTATDPDGLIDGPMGNDSLKSQIADINKLPKAEQAAAWRDLGDKTGLNPNKLYAANKRYERKQRAHNQVFAIQNSAALTSDQKKAKLEELAKKLNLSVEKLQASANNKLLRTKKKLELAKGSWSGIVGGDGQTSGDMAQLNKDLKEGKISPAQLEGKLKDIAKRTGIPFDDLKALHGHERFQGQQKEWAEKLNLKPASKASDYVAKKAREQGIPPEKVMDWLRYADPEKMSPADKELRGTVDGWHKKHPTKEEAKEAKARKDAGLADGETATQVCISDKDAVNLTGQAKVDYDQMVEHEQWIRDELDDSIVNESAIVDRLQNMPTRQLAALMQRFPELRQRLSAEIKNNYAQETGNNTMQDRLKAAWKKGAAHQQVVAGSAASKARSDKAAEMRTWALDVQEKTRASQEAATALGLEGPDGLDEARSHLKALSLGTGTSYADAVAHLKNQPGKTPKEVLKEAYTAKSKDGGPSEVLRRRLADINSLPPEQYAKAIEGLKGLSGLTDGDISAANKTMARDDAIAKKIHDLRHLSPEERKVEMEKLAARYGVDLDKLDELEATYSDRLAATEAALGDGALDDILAGSYKDVDAEAAKLAEKTGLPKDEIIRLIESKRDKTFATGQNAGKMGGANMEALRQYGDECDRSPEQMLDYLMRSPRSALPEHLQKLQDDLKAKLPDYEKQYSKAEQAALDKLRAKATDPEYLKKASLLKTAIEADDEDKFKEAIGKMSPAERALFRDEYNARRDKAKQEGGEVPEAFEDMVHSTVDGFWGDDSEGMDGESGQILSEIPQSSADAEARLLASVEAVDKSNPIYLARADAMMVELRKGGGANMDNLKKNLKQMSLAERAAFMADYKALQNAAAQRNLTDDKHKLPNLQEVLKDDPEGLRWVVDAQRAAATGIAASDAAETQKTEAAREAATEAAKALNMPRRDAYRLVQKQAKDLNVSVKNALRFLKGEEMVPDRDDALSPWLKDQIADLEKDWKKADPNAKKGETIGGHTLNEDKVNKEAERLQKMADGNGPPMTPMQIAGLLQKCNARELKELDDKLGGKLKAIVEKALARRQHHGGHGAHGGHRPPTSPGTLAEINNALHGMEDFRADETDLQLIDDAANMDPRAHADPSTPEGMAQRMAWAASLPAEKRIKAFNELRKQVPVSKMSAQQVMGAYLNGEQGTEGSMLSPTLLAELQRIEKLPPDERTEALKTFEAMTGRAPNDLRLAARDTAKKLDFAKQVAEIEKLPVDQQLAKLTELAESSKMSVNELQTAYDDALKAGLIKAELKPVGKHVAMELDRIKMIEDPEKRRAELSALAQANGLSQADVLGHLKARLDENRKKRRELAAHRKGAQKMDELFRKRDGEAIKKHLESFSGNPEKLKEIAKQMGGMDKLRAKMASQFGEDSNAFLDLDPILDMADQYTAEPKLPDGTNADMAHEINRIKKAGGDWQAALQNKYPDLTVSDLTELEKHADWSQKKLDLQVEHAGRQFKAELDSNWVEDDRIKELVNRYPHDVLLALAEKMLPARDLVEEIRDGVGADISEDFTEKLNQARMISKLPPEERGKALTQARVAYKFDQLNEEFNAAVYADDARIAELMKDCSPEELKLLNEKFDGKLESFIDANTGGPGLADVVGGLVTVALSAALGPLGAVIAGVVVRQLIVDDSDEQTLRDTQRKLRNGEVDYSKPPEERFPKNDERIDSAYKEITGELGDMWASDSDIIGALKSLNPRELQALAEKFEEDGNSLLDAIQGGLDPDAYAQAVAMVENAEDAMSGTDRQQEMKDRCRQLAIADRLKELKKDPKHKGKSDSELYTIVEREGSRIDKMAADRVKKIRDSANDIFKAVDGWWNDDAGAMLKTMAGLSPEEVEMVKVEYRRHFGRNFDIDIRDEMGFYNREEMKVAEKLMSSDPTRRVEGLREYLLEDYRMFGVEDEQMIFDTLESMSVEERTLLVSGYEGADFLETLKEDLGENEKKMVEALTHINPKTGQADANPAIVAAAKMKMHIHGSGDWWDFSAAGTKEEELIAELDKLTPAQIREAEAYYNQHLAEGGSTFIADMKDDFGDGRDWDIIEAEMRGDKVTADANRLKWAAQEDNWIGGGTDEDLLEKTLKAGKEGRAGRDAAHLAKVRARFNNMFGGEGDRYGGQEDDSRDAFDRMIDDETHGIESIYFKELGKKGEASDEITLLYAMQGDGTDEDKLKEVLNKYYDKTPAERAQFAALFQEQSRMLLGMDVSLEDWVESETSGAEGFDMKLLVMGKPTTPEEQLKVARMRWDFERGAGSGLGNTIMGIMDATGASSTAEILAENMSNLEALFDEEGKLLPGAQQRLEEVAAWQEQDTKNYRECKDSVAEAVGNTVAAVGAVAAGILTAGAAWYIMAAAAMAAAAAGTVFKAAIKGNSFGWEEGLQDVGAIAIAGLTAGMGGGAFKGLEAAAKAATTAFQKYAMIALKGAIEGAIESFLNALLTSEQAWEGGDVAFLTHILKSTALGGFNGAAGELVGELLKDGPLGKQIERIENGNPAAHSAGKHYVLKYANGVVKAAATTAIDPANWEAWADGKEIGLADIKKIFVMPAISAAMQTAKARDKGKTNGELEADAIKKVEDTETELADLEAKRAKLTDPAEIEAVDTQIRVMNIDLDEAMASRDFIIEDNEKLAERAAAKKRVEEALDNESDGKMDAMDEAGQTAAMRQLVENMDDEPDIEVTSGGKQILADEDVKAAAMEDPIAAEALRQHKVDELNALAAKFEAENPGVRVIVDAAALGDPRLVIATDGDAPELAAKLAEEVDGMGASVGRVNKAKIAAEDEGSQGPRYEEVEGGPLEGQRKLDNTDRVIEREALATLRETIIEDGMSKLADDPAEAMKVAHTIADLFDDTDGQAAVAKAIRFEDDPAKAIQAAHDLNEFSKIVDIDPKDMTEDQLRTVAKAAYHLQKQQLDFLAVAEADGIEAARAKHPDLRMRRVEDMDAIGNILSQKWGNAIAGYVGDADNTAGMTSHQVIGALGLDYSGIDEDSGQFWHSPFLSQDGAYQPFALDNRVAVLDFELTPDQIGAAKVAVHKDVVAQLQRDAELPGEEGEWARKMLDRVHDNAEPGLYDADERNLENPHTGTGATRAGEAHMTWGDGDDPSTLNQEQKINPGTSDVLPDGATVKILDEDGNLSPVAVMRNGKWQIADGAADLLPEDEFNAFKAKIQEQHDASHDRQVAEISEAFGEDGSDLTEAAKYRAKKRVQILDGAQGLDDPELRHAALEICECASARELRVLVDAMDEASVLAGTDPAAAQALLRSALIDDDGSIKRSDDLVRGEMRQATQVRDENGAVVLDDDGNPVGGSFVIQFGFDGRVDRAEGEYQVTKKILLLGDDANTDAVWGDITAGIDSVYGDAPRIEVPGDGNLKLKIQPQRMTLDDFPDAPDDPEARKAYFQERGIQVIAAHEGLGPADAENIYVGGAGAETDRMRQYIAAHEVTHGLGLPDTYQAATQELDGDYKLIVPDRQGDGGELVPDGGLMDSSSYMRPTEIEALPGETIGEIVQRHGIDIAKNPWVLDWVKSNNPQLVEGAMDGNLLLRPDLVAGERVTLPEFDLDAKGGLREHNAQWLEEIVARTRGGEDLSDMDLQDTPWARELMRDARQRAHEEGGADGPFVANALDGSRFSDDDGDRKQPIDTMTDEDRARYLEVMYGGSGASKVADDLEAANPAGAVPSLDSDDHEARLRVEMGVDEAPAVRAGPVPEISEGAKVGGAMQAVLGLAAVTDDMSDHERVSAERYRAILVHSMEHDDPQTQLAMLTIAYNGTEEHRRQLQVMLDSNPDPQTFDAWMAYLGHGVPALNWRTSAPAESDAAASSGEVGSSAAPAPGQAVPEALADVNVAKSGDLEDLMDDIAAGAAGLSGSRKKRAQDVVDILDHAADIEDVELRNRALKLAVAGNAQDREELLTLLKKGEAELANGLAEVEDAHEGWKQNQVVAQYAAKEDYPEHFAKVESHLGAIVPPLPPELEADYILQSNGVIRRRDADDTNFRLQVDEDGRLMVAEGTATPKPDVYAAYKTGVENLNDGEADLSDDAELSALIDKMASGDITEADIQRMAELGARAEAIGARANRIEADNPQDKRHASQHLGELAGKDYMANAYPNAEEVDGLCWDSSGTFDQIWQTPSGEFIIVEAKGGGATNSSSVEVNGVRYQQGHPKYAEAILEKMIKKHGNDPVKKAKLLELKAAWHAGKVRYLEVSQKLDDDGAPASIDVREYAQ